MASFGQAASCGPGQSSPWKPHGGTAGTQQNGEAEPEVGIAPDVVVELDATAARSIRQQLNAQDVPRPHRAAFAAVAAEFEFEVPAPPSAANDAQLATALERLRARVAAVENGSGRGEGK